MPADALALVQFIHPGQPAPDADLIKTWNRGPHRRKFLLAEGAYLLGEEQREGRVAFWASGSRRAASSRGIRLCRPPEVHP